MERTSNPRYNDFNLENSLIDIIPSCSGKGKIRGMLNAVLVVYIE